MKKGHERTNEGRQTSSGHVKLFQWTKLTKGQQRKITRRIQGMLPAPLMG